MKITQLPVPLTQVGEGPVWDVAEQALYYIDIVDRKVFRFDPDTGEQRSWPVPNMIGSMAIRAGGGAIVALVDGVHALDFETGAVTPFALLDPPEARVQLADGKVDRRGRFLVGTSHRQMKEPIGGVWSLEGARPLRRVDGDVTLGNGPCWSPDDRIFYHADSLRKMIYAYDYDIETGDLANRRPFASTEELGGIPDGATVDRDGLVWSAICEGGKVVAFRPDGRIERIIEMPSRLPGSVMFGGPNLDRLYVPTLSPAFMGRPVAPEDGMLFVIDGLGATGIAEPRFAG